MGLQICKLMNDVRARFGKYYITSPTRVPENDVNR